jgi:GNAT superfamily N-acetyltransferase
VGFGVCDTDASLINAVYVAPAMTRHGVGRALVSALEARLADAGATAVRLNATLNAVEFYTSLGYASVGATTNRLPSGIKLPCLAMVKHLTPDQSGAHAAQV